MTHVMTITRKKCLICAVAILLVAFVMAFFIIPKNDTHADSSITVHYQTNSGTPKIYYWNVNNNGKTPISWPGKSMTSEGNGWYSYTLSNASSTNLIFSVNGKQTSDLYVKSGEWWYVDGEFTQTNPNAATDSTYPVSKTTTIHYKSSWGATKIYYWNVGGTSNNPVTWPGVDMTAEGDNWYTYTIQGDGSNVIFTNGSQQTDDLSCDSGEWWYVDGKFTDVNPNATGDTSSADEIVLHYKSSWGATKVYYWNVGGTTNNPVTWPGVAMTSEGNSWYTYTIKGASANVIFNNGGSQQTDDLSAKAGELWYSGGKWYTSNPEATVAPTATPEPTVAPTVAPTATPEPTVAPTVAPTQTPVSDNIVVHYYSEWGGAKIYYWNTNGESNNPVSWPGVAMTSEGGKWYTYTFEGISSTNLIFNYNGNQTSDLTRTTGEWWYKNNNWYSSKPADDSSNDDSSEDDNNNQGDQNNDDDVVIVDKGSGNYNYTRTDFRDETIYFLMTTRFYDGDSSNNVHCWDDAQAGNPDSDPAWRGDFQGIIDQLDYIKALGFTAIWITPVVENASGYDYHGYHALDFKTVDSRYESKNASYQDLIDACHAKGIKIIQDIVLNHTSNFGEINLFPMFKKNAAMLETSDCLERIDNGKLPSNYDSLTPAAQYSARIDAMKNDASDVAKIYHHEKSLSWESYTVQTGQIAGDCVDLNTENPVVYNYLIDAFNQYIDMGVDGFRVDTVKHISRLTFNKTFIPAFKERGGEDFYIFGEVCTRYRDVWNSGIPAISCPFYTWKESKNYAWGDTATNEASVAKNWADNSSTANQPTSNNAFLSGNNYHSVDYSMKSGLDVIDFPMHWSFNNARDAFGVALSGDKYYNDATWNVTYVDSHDYAPDCAPENQRFAGSQDTWAENLNLMFTFRGIPCIYYGSEIEFMKGAVIDVGPNKPLSETGRAYFGGNLAGNVTATDFGVYTASGTVKNTLSHPLSLHIQRLNKIRQAVPALRKGQYSTEGVSGSMAFKRRYSSVEEGIDSFVLVNITDGATFSGVPNGKYVDAITGETKTVTNGTLSSPSVGKGNMRVWVLDTSATPAPGKVGVDGKYLK